MVDITGADFRELDHQRHHHDHLDDEHNRADDDHDFTGHDGRAVHVQFDNEHRHPHDVTGPVEN
jgi:hypothetical protein